MAEFVQNAPVRSCCGRPRGACTCKAEAKVTDAQWQGLESLAEDVRHERRNPADMLPPAPSLAQVLANERAAKEGAKGAKPGEPTFNWTAPTMLD